MEDNYGIYKYVGPYCFVPTGKGSMLTLREGMKVKAEVNINIATIKSVLHKYDDEYEDVKPVYVAAKYLEPVKPETIDFTKDDADKESAKLVVDMITDDFPYTIFRDMAGKGNIYQALKRIQDAGIPRREAEKLFNDDAHEVGGSHYKMAIEPWDYIFANKLDFDSGNVVKYISRHKKKNGAEDVKKAISFCKHILKTQYGEEV